MNDAILALAHDLMSSWWIYLALFGFAMLDGFFPAVPSETLVVTAGVFAALGEPDLYGVIAVAAAGAFLGDHISYFIGRGAGARVVARFKPGSKKSAMFEWSHNALAERGGLVLVVARYIPGGRTAVTLTMGTVRYPLRKFSLYATLAAVSWGVYGALVGFIGGKAFEENPLAGVALGIGLALAVTVVVEVVRHQLRKRRTTVEADEPELVLSGQRGA
ncbi:DedA family protein [Kribbella deserti]|uniref:DedA family protein n=1 Tax=Kribbella deserti TaxID=1926257 RepID=A0ABV6QM34_9ACTN